MRISDWSSDVCSSDLSIGERRISLLTLLQIGITILALYAGVKLVNRLVGQSVKRASGLDSTQQLLVQKLVAIGRLVIASFVGIDLVGIDLTALAVFSGGLGLAGGDRQSPRLNTS